MMTQVNKLKALDGIWRKGKEANLLPCRIASERGVDDGGATTSGIVLNNLQYSRGTAIVSTEHLAIEPGIYAVTGANGSGKSTLFRLLMACDTNERPIDLHESIELATPIHRWDLSDRLVLPKDSCKVPDEGCEVIVKDEEQSRAATRSAEDPAASLETQGEGVEIPVTSIVMPSPDVVEISQVFYWPLYTKPIDWIYQKHITYDLSESEREECVRRVAEELQSLSFAQSQENAKAEYDVEKEVTSEVEIARSNNSVIERLMEELQVEKEDWFSELSGGQKSKVELVRKVFLRSACPSVLLVGK